jgi:hypothetical protein
MTPRPAQPCRSSISLGQLSSPAGSLLCRPCPQGLHSPASSMLCWPTTPRPAQPYMISSLPGHIPKACHTKDTNTHDLCSAGPGPQGLHSTAQYSLHKPVPLRPAKLGTHTHMISILLDHAPQAYQARDPQTWRISTPPACTLQAYQAHTPNTHCFTSAKGLHPQARRTPLTVHLPQEGCKPT